MNELRDPALFDSAYQRLYPTAFARANRVLRDEAAAEDVVQDVFVQLWLKPDSYDPSRGSLSRYVTVLAHSRALDRWRSRSAREAAVDRSAQQIRLRQPEHGESAAEPVFRRDGTGRLLTALTDLPSDQREAVLLAYGRGLTAQEISKAAEVPLGTAKSRIRLGLQKARANLEAAAA